MNAQETVVAPTSSGNAGLSTQVLLCRYAVGFAAGLLTCFGIFAWLFRYEPLPSSVSAPLIWDRWAHQLCVAVPFQGARGLQCGEAGVSVIIDPSNKLGVTPLPGSFSGAQTGTPSWQSSRALLRQLGFSEKQIGETATKLRETMSARGTPQDQINAYFGDYQFPP